jgi:hypothetical protein
LQRLKLKYDEPLSNFVFKFNLRRYNMVATADPDMALRVWIKAGAYSRPLLIST